MISLEKLRAEFESSFVSEDVEYKSAPHIALSFNLHGEYYCFPLSYVQEVVKLPHIVAVPKAPGFILGVFNLRGEILTLNCMGRFLNLGGDSHEDVSVGSMAIILKSDHGRLGVYSNSTPRLIRFSDEDYVQNLELGKDDIISAQINLDNIIYSLINPPFLYDLLMDQKNWEGE